MKKTAALLILGLIIANVLHAEVKAPERSQTASVAPAAPTEPRTARAGDDYVTLNFTNIDITALVKLMSELTRRNFILDEKITGKITLMTPTKISPDEAYQVFLSALEIKGFTAVEDGKIIRIVAASGARQSGLKVVKDGDYRGEGYVTKLIRMDYVNPNDIVRTLTSLVSKDGSIIAYPATNSIIVTDAVNNIRKIENLIRALDVTSPEGKGKINVYYLKNANAEDFAKVMAALVGKVGKLPAPGAAGAQQAGATSILEGQVTITADKSTNSLIIVASPVDFETIKDVIQKLDIRRRQVYVEVAIVEMSLAKQRELGFEFQAAQSGDIANANGAVGGTNFGNIGPAVAGGPAALAGMNGLTVGMIKGTFTYNSIQYLSIGALLRALQTDGEVNVLSTPSIVTTDNQKAEIMVGENVPFITGQTQNATTGTGSLFNTVDRKDVGIKLALTPQISSDDNVRLEVNQEISDVIASSTSNAAGPTTSKRSASTTVVVKDRQTMVIGGLIRDNATSSTMKVPLLGDIPLLGWFFKYKTTRIEKTNLMIFITPYIIKGEAEASDITHKKDTALEDFRKEYRIEKKNGEPILPSPPAPSQPQPSDKAHSVRTEVTAAPISTPTGTIEKKKAVVAPISTPTGTIEKKKTVVPQSAPTGSAAAVRSSPTDTTRKGPAGVVR